MNFYSQLETILLTDAIERKESLLTEAMEYCNTEEVTPEAGFAPRSFETPSYARRCRIVAPRDLPRRRKFTTTEGLALQVHAIAHIEYSAVDLAVDAVYRFPEMPREYKRDWLEVAQEEIRHFGMLERILEALGHRYGDFPVHRGLFDAAKHTEGDVLDRMAVIPRHYEATGLDVNPRIVEKLTPLSRKPEVAALLEALEVIYEEEIDHVRKGDRWFRYVCRERGLDPERTFMEILARYRLAGTRAALNVEARREAGFACSELLHLGAETCEE